MSRLGRILTFEIALAAAVSLYPKVALSAVSFSGDTTFGSQVLIGNSTYGTFRIDGGSVYTNTTSSTIIGQQTGGIGLATVTGAGSQWNGGVSLDVASSGVGRLEVLNGGVVNWAGTQGTGQLRIAVNSSSQGTVVVQGSGSLLAVGTLSLGSTSSGGSSLLQILDNGIVNASSSQTTIGTGGRVELSGGLLRANQLTLNGVIVGSGEVNVQSTSSISNNGRIESDTGNLLRLTGPSISMQNFGIIAADGGEIELNRTVTNTTSGSNSGEITLRDGIVRVGTTASSGPQLTNSAVLAATGGTNDFYGRVSNSTTGQIAATNHSVLIFHDDVIADGGVITVFPGSTAVFLEDLTMNAGSTLQANLAGTNQNTGFGTAEVVGNAQFAGAGSVQAILANGYTPKSGDTFPLVAAGAITGSLSLGAMPSLPNGLMWDLDVEANRLILSVVPGLAGDYNRNNTVDAADYIVWLRSLGQTGADLAADGDSNGKVDAADYDFWQSRLGNTLGNASANASVVPEPATLVVFFVAMALVSCGRARLN
jgi:T5SS/PEP-CTERM-associated repeat protein